MKKLKPRKWQYAHVLGFLFIFILSFSLVYALGSTDTGYRADKSTVVKIDEWGECRKVDNSGVEDYFVPTKTSQEWESFRTVADTSFLPGISTSACCDDVDIGGETICLEEGATATGFNLPCIWYLTVGPDARARYLNGKVQTRASRNWAGCDSGWVDGFYAECNSNTYPINGIIETTTTVKGVRSSIYVSPYGGPFYYTCTSPTIPWVNP